MKTFDTVVEAINELKKNGFSIDLNISFDAKICSENGNCLDPAKFEIIETYRFEGDTNPSDEDIVYALASKDGKIKGIFTGAFGMYANAICSESISHLSNHK